MPSSSRTSLSGRSSHDTKPTLYSHFESKAHLLMYAITNEKRGYIDRMSVLLDDSWPARERFRCLIEECLLLANQMPLTARLIRGEQDILLAVAMLDQAHEFAGSDTARNEALRTSFHEELLEMFAGDVLSAEQRRERANVIAALTFCTGTLAEKQELRQGLSYEGTVSLLATMLAGGVDTPEPETRPSPR